MWKKGIILHLFRRLTTNMNGESGHIRRPVRLAVGNAGSLMIPGSYDSCLDSNWVHLKCELFGRKRK